MKAINHLSYELQFCPRSRSMSLLAYCYYMSQDFLNSARVYEQLSKFYPEVTEYKLYLAQSHYKNGDFEQALKVSQAISDPASQQKVILLQSLIRYEQDEIQHAKSLLRQGIISLIQPTRRIRISLSTVAAFYTRRASMRRPESSLWTP